MLWDHTDGFESTKHAFWETAGRQFIILWLDFLCHHDELSSSVDVACHQLLVAGCVLYFKFANVLC